MYAVVGCSECSALWIVEGRSETSQCPRCGARRPFDARKKFVETDDAAHAREVRASMLANRQDEGEAFASVDSVAELESQVEEGVVDDETYLAESGLDVDEVRAAGERDPRGSTSSGSRKEIVERAIADLDRPTADEVVAYAEERGVPSSYTERALEKFVRNGDASESRGRYRLL